MTEANIHHYREAQSDILLQPLVGQERFHVLDIHSITMGAPDDSAADGIHYTEAVYDAAAHVLLNMLAAKPSRRTAKRKRTCGLCDTVP